MKLPLQNPAWAAVLSFLVPGLGQAVGGKLTRGAIVAIPAVVLFFVFLPVYLFANASLIRSSAGLTSLLVVDVIACVYHLWAVVDAYIEIKPHFVQRGMRGVTGRRATIPLEFATLISLVVATVGVHAYLGLADLSSCTMQGRPCPQTDSSVAVAARTPGDGLGSGAGSTAGDGSTPSGSTDGASPSASAEVTPTASPVPSGSTAWRATADRLRVHSGPGTDYPTIKVLRQSQSITGQVVAGHSYTVVGVSYSVWIHIDAGQPGGGGYVAVAYYVNAALATSTPEPSTSPSDGASPSASPSPAF